MIISRVLHRNLTTTMSKCSPSGYEKLYDNHIPLNNLQKTMLAVGSGLGAILNPHRHDLVADFGETTGFRALNSMRSRMRADEEGRRVLMDRPRLKTDQIDYEALKELPKNTFGYHYSQFYELNGVSPDTRKVVQFVDDEELAYVMQRYRELHDIVHTLLNQPTTIHGEVIVKAFEGAQTGLPLCVLGALIGPVRLSLVEQVDYLRRDLPWALRAGRQTRFLMNVYFEERFQQDLEELRNELKLVKVLPGS